MKTRIAYIDALRILAIYLVVLVHNISLPQIVSPQTFLTDIVFCFAKTGVPLFVMISGALLLGKKESYTEFFKKRMSKILIPWILWSILFFLIENPNPAGSIGELSQTILTRFWFLPLIVCLYAITPFLRLAIERAKKTDILILVGLCFLSISVIPFFHNTPAFPLHTDNGLVRQTVMYLGYYLAGYLLASTTIKKYTWLFPIGIVGGLLGIYFVTIYSDPKSFIYFEYLSPFIVITTISLFLLVKQFAEKLRNTKALQGLAESSFGVIFIHELFRVFGVIDKSQSLVVSILYGTIIFIVSIGVVFLLRKVKAARGVLV